MNPRRVLALMALMFAILSPFVTLPHLLVLSVVCLALAMVL